MALWVVGIAIILVQYRVRNSATSLVIRTETLFVVTLQLPTATPLFLSIFPGVKPPLDKSSVGTRVLGQIQQNREPETRAKR